MTFIPKLLGQKMLFVIHTMEKIFSLFSSQEERRKNQISVINMYCTETIQFNSNKYTYVYTFMLTLKKLPKIING